MTAHSTPITPLLTEEVSSRADYESADYAPVVTFADSTISVAHQTLGHTPIEGLVASGKALYVTDIRVPRILFCATHKSVPALQTLALPCNGTIPSSWPAYVLPGVVAADDCTIPATYLNPHVRGNAHSVVVPKGRWIAKGEIRSVMSHIAALLAFEKKSDLNAGEMNVYQRQDEDNPTFVVQLAEDTFSRIAWSRDVWIAGLVGVCTKLPYSTFREGDVHWDHEIALYLRTKLEKANLADWSDPENWNPARVATLLEPFRPAEKDDSDD